MTDDSEELGPGAHPPEEGRYTFDANGRAWVAELVPFFLATCALGVALVVVPVSVAVGAWRRLRAVHEILAYEPVGPACAQAYRSWR